MKAGILVNSKPPNISGIPKNPKDFMVLKIQRPTQIIDDNIA